MCLVLRPWTRLRHRLKAGRDKCRRINMITDPSFRSNCVCIASKGVRSSHAISMIRDNVSGLRAESGMA